MSEAATVPPPPLTCEEYLTGYKETVAAIESTERPLLQEREQLLQQLTSKYQELLRSVETEVKLDLRMGLLDCSMISSSMVF
jgi:hypothetical protein